MTQLSDEVVERVALGIAKEIGWGTFSHFNPDDMRRISRAAIEAYQAYEAKGDIAVDEG